MSWPARSRKAAKVSAESGALPDWAEVDFGDACELPAEIRKRRYDLVFSNSVIEHVGGHERRLRLAEAIHDLADRHWVQTPYRYFPVEPHFVAPGMQFMPAAAQAAMLRKWPLVHTPPGDKKGAVESALWVELLGRTQMRFYFPDSELRSERFAGLTKSLIAVKTG